MTKTNVDPRSALETQGRKLYCDEDVLKTMPEGTGATVEFFTLGRYVSDDALAKEYADRGLVPASPYDIALIPRETLAKFVATHWKNDNGDWCYAAFGDWLGGPDVDVDRDLDGWDDDWTFAGVRSGAALGSSSPLSSSAEGALQEAIAAVKAAGYKIFKEI